MVRMIFAVVETISTVVGMIFAVVKMISAVVGTISAVVGMIFEWYEGLPDSKVRVAHPTSC